MSAGVFVGRVGGLAVALGIGAAVMAGAAVAQADDGSGASGGTTSASASPSDSTPAKRERPVRRPTTETHRQGVTATKVKTPTHDEAMPVAKRLAVQSHRVVTGKPFARLEHEPIAAVTKELVVRHAPETTVTTKLSARIANRRTDEADAPPISALASLVTSFATARREAVDDAPPSVAHQITTSLADAGYPIPEDVTVTETRPPLLWLQKIPVVGTFVVTPAVTLLHAIPLVGDALQPIIGFPIDHFAPAGAPQAASYWVTSFDGTRIYVNFMPSLTFDEFGRAPTVLDGPGLGLPGSTALNLEKDELLPHDVIGIGALRQAGYNVVTWDPRGEWRSGGRMQLQSPDYEGRDVSSIISWLATLPEVALDDVNDPKIGMVGASYGGGIQLATAVVDHRIDAIVPTIAWNSLTDVLFPRGAVRSGWATLLSGALVLTLARPNERILPAAIRGILTGKVDPADIDLLNDRGYQDRIGEITTPTLLFQGTVDTLFTLNQADANAKALLAAGTPTKVVWYCGGHGACLSTKNDGVLVVDRTMDWLDHYVKGDEHVDTGALFEYVDQNGQWYESDEYPIDVTDAPVTAGSVDPKRIPFIPFIGGSGPDPRIIKTGLVGILLGLPSAAPAVNAVNLQVPPVTQTTHIVGAPELTLTYSGKGNATHVYAQIVDDQTHLVLGNQATPIPVVLDGQTRTMTYSLEQVAETLAPGQSVHVQIVTSTIDFLNFYSFGSIDVKAMSVSLPTVNPVGQPVAVV